jgi:hypothetical protein
VRATFRRLLASALAPDISFGSRMHLHRSGSSARDHPLTENLTWQLDRFRPIEECSAQTVLLLLVANLGKAKDSDTSLGMNMDVVELVIYGLLALWGPPLLFAAYLLRPLK